MKARPQPQLDRQRGKALAPSLNSKEGTVVALGIVGTMGVVVVDDGKGDAAELLVELRF